MAERTTHKHKTKQVGRAAAGPARRGFTDEERAAMKERAKELRSAGRRGAAGTGDDEGEALVRDKLAAMPAADRALGERIHAIVMAAAPGLTPRLWYGMPAYAKDDKVICFFQNAQKFKTRYSTLGFSDKSQLDDGAMWPVAFAITRLTAADEARIAALVKRAVG